MKNNRYYKIMYKCDYWETRFTYKELSKYIKSDTLWDNENVSFEEYIFSKMKDGEEVIINNTEWSYEIIQKSEIRNKKIIELLK